jgi:hypothetical protein
MRKVGVSKGSAAPSPVPGSTSESAGGEAMRRTGSGGASQSKAHLNIRRSSYNAVPRVASALSSRKDSPIPRNDPSIPGTPGRPTGKAPMSKTSRETDNFSSSILSHIISQYDNYIAKLRPCKPSTYSCCSKSTITFAETQVSTKFFSHRTTYPISSSRSFIISRRKLLGILL